MEVEGVHRDSNVGVVCFTWQPPRFFQAPATLLLDVNVDVVRALSFPPFVFVAALVRVIG